MQIINRNELEKDVDLLKSGIFIYPTDTIYGIGCDSTKENFVKRIREMKGRDKKPFSIIVPDKEWIFDNCVVNELGKIGLDKLPGPYTFIFKLKNKVGVSWRVSLGEKIGIRIPNHWISEVVKRLGNPIVTTSANISGQKNMTSLDDLDEKIAEKVDFIIYDGELGGQASEIWDLSGKRERKLR
jgi:tRNA threonylcarbamoyl adenosine modification protein (Sua5/YciO/YrdC/YwlC family)